MIIEANKTHADQIAAIHFQELADDFLPSLGCNFLEVMYSGILGKKDIWGFCYQNNLTKRIEGFVIGTNNIKTFFGTVLKSKGLSISSILLIQILKKPSLIKNILSTLLYPKKESVPKAELVVICVRKEFQGRGIGKKLVKSLENVFKKRKIQSYKLTVYQNKVAINFYQQLGFKRKSSFSLYGKLWLVYQKYLN